MHDKDRLSKKLRVVLALPLIPLLINAVIMVIIGSHHPQDLILGPVVLCFMAPVVISLLYPVLLTRKIPKGIRVIQPTRHR